MRYRMKLIEFLIENSRCNSKEDFNAVVSYNPKIDLSCVQSNIHNDQDVAKSYDSKVDSIIPSCCIFIFIYNEVQFPILREFPPVVPHWEL